MKSKSPCERQRLHSVSVPAYRSVYGVVTLWERAAIPVSNTHTKKNPQKPHWAATCILIVTAGWHLPRPLTFDWSHVLSDCDTLACSCGSSTAGSNISRVNALHLTEEETWAMINRPYILSLFMHETKSGLQIRFLHHTVSHLSFNLLTLYFTELPFRGP